MSRARYWARRIYLELVRGRERVRWIPVATPPHQMRHGMILGLHRSGTTPLRYALNSHPEVAVPPESEFLLDLIDAADRARALKGLEGLGVQPEDYRGQLRQLAFRIFESYARGVKPESQMWIDKTPRYAPRANDCLKFFPDAYGVFICRHPIGQVASATGGGRHQPAYLGELHRSTDPVLAAAEYWRDTMVELARAYDAAKGRSIVLSYESLCMAPEETLRHVCRFLDLPWSPEMLEYGRHDHSVGLEGSKALGHKGFVTPDYGGTRLTQAQQEAVWSVCEDVASQLGYGVLDGSPSPEALVSGFARVTG